MYRDWGNGSHFTQNKSLTWFCTRSLTLSMGAAAVLETPAATPESIKFSANPNFWLDILVGWL